MCVRQNLFLINNYMHELCHFYENEYGYQHPFGFKQKFYENQLLVLLDSGFVKEFFFFSNGIREREFCHNWQLARFWLFFFMTVKYSRSHAFYFKNEILVEMFLIGRIWLDLKCNFDT